MAAEPLGDGEVKLTVFGYVVRAYLRNVVGIFFAVLTGTTRPVREIV